jgi:hypothetical protein
MENKVMGHFFFEETTVTGDTFLTTVEDAALRHAPVGTFSN